MNAALSRRQFLASSGAAAIAGVAALDAKQAVAQDASQVIWNTVCDVLVIGFGGAGAVAAIAAADEGAQVLLVDKAPQYLEGGNTRYSEQYNLMWEDEQTGYEFMTCMADGKADMTEDILRFIARETVGSFDWVEQHGGRFVPASIAFPNRETFEKVFGMRAVDLERSNWVAEMDDGTFPFFEYCQWPNGGGLNNGRVEMQNVIEGPAHHKTYWEFLRNLVEARTDSIACWFNAPATELIQDPETGVVMGAVIDHNGEPTNVYARRGVVLACGSYEADRTKRETYADRKCLFVGTPYNTGDGIDMAGKVGAQMWHMSSISGPFIGVSRPLGGDGQAWWIGGGLNRMSNNGHSIFVTADGKRFMRECGYNHHGFVAVGDGYQNQQLPEVFYAIMDAAGLAASQCWGAPSYVKIDEDQIISGETLEELTEKLGIDPEGLAATVEAYNRYCGQGFDEEFARYPETLEKIEGGPYYGVLTMGDIVNAQGGPKRNTACQVLDYNNEPIPHLYSAGELGSFWGGIYIAGGNVAETCYSGRVAGQQAATCSEVEAAPQDLPMPVNEIAVYDPDAIASSYDCADNEWIGSSIGVHGPVVVKVVLDGETIAAVEVLSQCESPDVVRDLFTVLPERIVEANGVEVDGIAGATIASRALKDAVTDAVARAGVVPVGE